MSRINTDDMRARLLKLRDELQTVGASNAESSKVVELDQSRVGRLSRMDALQAQAMSQAFGQRQTEALQRIRIALKRLDRGDYGTCQSCDEPINEKRLEIDPTVTLCIDCAEKAERT